MNKSVSHHHHHHQKNSIFVEFPPLSAESSTAETPFFWMRAELCADEWPTLHCWHTHVGMVLLGNRLYPRQGRWKSPWRQPSLWQCFSPISALFSHIPYFSHISAIFQLYSAIFHLKELLTFFSFFATSANGTKLHCYAISSWNAHTTKSQYSRCVVFICCWTW